MEKKEAKGFDLFKNKGPELDADELKELRRLSLRLRRYVARNKCKKECDCGETMLDSTRFMPLYKMYLNGENAYCSNSTEGEMQAADFRKWLGEHCPRLVKETDEVDPGVLDYVAVEASEDTLE